MLGLMSLQSMADLFVASVSLMFGLGFFAFVASILSAAAFLHHAKDVPA